MQVIVALPKESARHAVVAADQIMLGRGVDVLQLTPMKWVHTVADLWRFTEF